MHVGCLEARKLPGRSSLSVAPVYEARGLVLSTVTRTYVKRVVHAGNFESCKCESNAPGSGFFAEIYCTNRHAGRHGAPSGQAG
eukprot:349185-Prymnesium_polylepis.1